MQKLEQKVDMTISNIDRKMETIDQKLAGVDDTIVVMERVMNIISEVKDSLSWMLKLSTRRQMAGSRGSTLMSCGTITSSDPILKVPKAKTLNTLK